MYVYIYINLIDVVIVFKWNVYNVRRFILYTFEITCSYLSKCTIKFTYERVKIESADPIVSLFVLFTRRAISNQRIRTAVVILNIESFVHRAKYQGTEMKDFCSHIWP